MIFFLTGAFFIISTQNLHLGKGPEFNKFGNLYYEWILGIGKNFGSITAYVVHSEWLPGEQQFSAEKSNEEIKKEFSNLTEIEEEINKNPINVTKIMEGNDNIVSTGYVTNV
jgi:hypothetical protein